MEPATIVIIGIVVALGWILFRFLFKITAFLFRLGCLIIFLLVIGGTIYLYLNQPL